ncbi:MAG TPA: ATP-binding protein [Verrucomicrobiae bacterium]|nr:ATP-binding protein [Verrucomicrobiae bacterium]
MTIPQRILLHVALGAGLVIAVATGVTYGIVFESSKQRDLKHLATYVTERARREAIGFQHIQANMLLVRGQFLKRMQAPIPRDVEEKWNARFELFRDASWRSKTNFWDGRKYSTMWAHKDCAFTPELKTEVLRAQDICDELLPGWVDVFPSVYFVLAGSPGWLNVGFDPRIPNWVWDTPADYNATNLEWFHLAMPAATPPDAFGWTGIIEEPTTKVPIVSIYVPIFKDGQFLGSLGHDEYVNRMMEEITHSDLPGARHVIFRGDGRIVAHPTKLQEILATKGQLLMQNCGEPEMASLYRAVVARTGHEFSGFDEASGFYYSVARLAGPDWYFLTTMPRELLQKQAFQSAQWVLWSGLVSLALLLGFLAATLRRQIAMPLTELTRATKQMSAGDNSARATFGRSDELGELASAFNEMAGRVAQRDAELQAEKASLEQRVSERTLELQESETRFVTAFRHSPAMQSLIRASDRMVVEANDTFLNKLGYTREQVVGKTATELDFWAEPEQLTAFVGEMEAKGFVLGREVRVRAKDGRILTALLSSQRVEIGGVPHLLSAGVDITVRKEAEAELLKNLERARELSELKSNFVSLVSHEFRTPLEVIMSSVDNLDRYHARLPAEKRQQLLHSINKAVRRMAGMMEEVLVLGRLETDRVTFQPAVLDLATLCQRISGEIESATSRRCPIDFRFEGDIGGAVGDESLLRHIFTNLLSNSVKYSPAGQHVEFVVQREGDQAVCRFTDRGCGIPEADQKRLFQAFHRGSNVDQIPGTGLGLLIVERCVELHGGEIKFESVEGQGTTFTVKLPLFTKAVEPNPTI